MALKMAVGLQTADVAKMDVNGDGQVTEVDALQILKWAAAGGQCGVGVVGVTPVVTPVVAVNAKGANNVGSLEFELIYDTAVLQAVGVEKGTLAGNAMIDSSVERPGRVWVGMVDSNGINGDGSLVVVSFQKVGEGQIEATLTLENVVAHNAATLIDIITQVSPGSLTTPPTITFVR